MKYKILLVLSIFTVAACGKSNTHSIYSNLADDQDGVVSADIIQTDTDSEGNPISISDWSEPLAADQLTSTEISLIKKYHSSQTEKVNFVIADAGAGQIIRSLHALAPKRLASLTKLSTSIAALENVSNIEVSKIQAMLKTSDNSEASRYVRLAAKAIDNLETPGSPFQGHSSCPSSTRIVDEYPAAEAVFAWIKNAIPRVAWTDAELKDGAGCDYGNHMSPVQLINLLKYADDRGPVYDGKDYEKLLSIAGVDGTWRNRNTESRGKILAKTGTLAVASNLAGYFYVTRSSKTYKYYFSVLIEKTSAENIGNARALTENLLRYWIKFYASNAGTPIGQF